MKIEGMKSMRFQSAIVILAFLISMSFSTDNIRSSAGKDVPGSKAKDVIVNKIYLFDYELDKRLKEYHELGKINFQDLRSIIEDKDYGDKMPLGKEARIYAALQMSNIQSKDVIKYQLEHITLYIPKQVIIADDDESKSSPHKYGLKSRGWEVIPYIFEHIRKTRNEKEMLMITELFVDICGQQMSKAILEVKKQENPPSVPENKIFNKNITFILEHIKK